ncbi:helix-turn-helix domain-containing protein [Caldanaerobius polysaccharolyticus]|uniref:helix-turn-helix domain-containing protein n=1 Tax=Caldanaerobius polysaccharolyticus TaxID=44256 RepID=UPI00047A1197|nr:helix-turn-helix domain-containing protein [Caldanaerobius polysaccharolyticus]
MSELKEVGEILKNKRLEKNISISDVQEFTKIKSYYIKAIEEGDEDKLPDPVYVKGFIKSYAEMVGLNGNELIKDLKFNKNKDYRPTVVTNESKKPNIKAKPLKKKRGKYIAAVIVLALFVYGFYLLGNFLGVKINGHSNNGIQDNYISDSTISKGDSQKPKNETPTPANTSDNNPQTKAVLNLVNKTADKMTYKVVTDNNSYKLKIDIVGTECWMNVYIDGNSVFSGLLTSGQSKEFDINSSSTAKIKLGKASDAAISIDGQAVQKADVPGIFWYEFTN